jgi:GTPase SAR1 family protein
MIKRKFVQSGIDTYIIDFDEKVASDQLTPAIYTVGHNPFRGFYLQKNKEKFDTVRKPYGSLKARTDRIIKTYEDRSSGTGILLTGLKGAGKTLLAQRVSNKMLEKGFPVILVESAYSGEAFTSFLNSIGECVIIFDEFAKVFASSGQNDKDHQDELLGIFDGNKSSKRLIFVIDNEERRMNDFYRNRPGRLFYHFQYSKLEEAAVEEYCDDHSLSQEAKTQLKSAYYRIRSFSFDILKAIVDEHKRYPEEDIMEIVNILNIDTESHYKTVLILKSIKEISTGKEFQQHKKDPVVELEFRENMRHDFIIHEKGIKISDDIDEATDEGLAVYATVSDHSVIFESKDKVIVNGNGYLFEFAKKQKSNFDYHAL